MLGGHVDELRRRRDAVEHVDHVRGGLHRAERDRPQARLLLRDRRGLARRPNPAVPIKAAGCFAHEAVAWHRGILYETEDNGKPSGFYRWLPERQPREFGDLATTGGPLQAIKRKGSATSFNAETAVVGETFEVEWVTIPNPDPPTNSVRTQGIALGHDLLQPPRGLLGRRRQDLLRLDLGRSGRPRAAMGVRPAPRRR